MWYTVQKMLVCSQLAEQSYNDQGRDTTSMERVLHILPNLAFGGAETTVVHLYRAIDKKKLQFDFLLTHEIYGAYEDEVKNLGGCVYRIPHILTAGYGDFMKNLGNFYRIHPEYNIVHCHMNEWSGLYLSAAKRCGVPVRIAHSHSTRFSSHGWKDIAYMPFRLFMKAKIKASASDLFACGDDAGRSLFGKRSCDKIQLLRNARPLKHYAYDERERSRLRALLGIPAQSFVICQISSFIKLKNHIFSLEVYKDLLRTRHDATLVFVGTGPLEDSIREQAAKMGLKNVQFLGVRSDVHVLLSVFDAMILPSLFEGLPSVIIEAQAAALPCLISDRVTREADVGMGLTRYLSLKKSPQVWADALIAMESDDRGVSTEKLYEMGYDVETMAKKYMIFCLQKCAPLQR